MLRLACHPLEVPRDGEQTAAQEPQENSHTLGFVHNYYYNDLQKSIFQATVLNYYTYLGGGEGFLAQDNEDLLHGRGTVPPHPSGSDS